ncbi:vegetative cell wall protein gp1-like [Panicum virgatum]|uniref:vegetative cell wall protein gp1-like n=1 Tax=Panicum virgatum TaxID=38727 RepID=UPI0019D50A8A|nr:vegetative cell wall protein gp1-like [Panicum virgatum]
MPPALVVYRIPPRYQCALAPHRSPADSPPTTGEEDEQFRHPIVPAVARPAQQHPRAAPCIGPAEPHSRRLLLLPPHSRHLPFLPPWATPLLASSAVCAATPPERRLQLQHHPWLPPGPPAPPPSFLLCTVAASCLPPSHAPPVPSMRSPPRAMLAGCASAAGFPARTARGPASCALLGHTMAAALAPSAGAAARPRPPRQPEPQFARACLAGRSCSSPRPPRQSELQLAPAVPCLGMGGASPQVHHPRRAG